eukprot:CAMPEP_0196132390 /NCGR_PEP_ID=MMETSP0910-20130528/2036_1 /TAXON_ID=49265 /ORGANISM="Thalassiosira rotula, Strain GSO102" /LENGTH=524 /DNA_ID=CAMNT_0041391997 /DNA_START=104 /DNA_END=1678 /DNA_ORIENTATION=-
MGCTSSKLENNTERVMNGRIAIDKSERIHTQSERAKLAQQRAVASANAANKKSSTPQAPPKLDSEGHLIAEEVAKRISGSVESKEIILGDLKSGNDEGIIHVQYAALTQRGYYPDKPHKENQDAYYTAPSKFASGEGDAFFAVFDGHGDAGHDCARFAKEKLHAYLAGGLKKQRAAANAAKLREMTKNGQEKPKNAFHPSSWPYLSVEQYETCCRNAHLQCNTAMHKESKVKDMMSGTTAISVGFHAGRITVSNVGDSRVVLGHRINDYVDSTPAEEEKKEIGELSDSEHAPSLKGGTIMAIPLSEDQTPYRKDERDRLKAAGARVCSIDQMEGKEPMHENWGEVDLGVDIDEHGDPPRVWCMDHDYPGTAFSRSLGDGVGEDIGVNAEPEIVTKEVTKGDEILVIASDGIFEFITNQRVIDICAECSDPMVACTKLLEESYKQWLHYELRTDDITCIVLFLKNGKANDDAVVKKLMGKRHRIKKAATTKGKTPLQGSMAKINVDPAMIMDPAGMEPADVEPEQ